MSILLAVRYRFIKEINKQQSKLLKLCAQRIVALEDQWHESMKREVEMEKRVIDMAIAWRIHLERPEIDMRDDLDNMIVELEDQVAALEEHLL